MLKLKWSQVRQTLTKYSFRNDSKDPTPRWITDSSLEILYFLGFLFVVMIEVTYYRSTGHIMWGLALATSPYLLNRIERVFLLSKK